MKKPIITISKEQFDFIQNKVKTECLAVAEQEAFRFIFHKEIREVKHAYCSAEYNTIQDIVNCIWNGTYVKRLKIV